jgi:phosphoglycerate dehydrogenase-like enzyme
VTDTFRVAVLDDYQGVAEGLAEWPPDVRFFQDHVVGAELVERLADVDAVVVMRERAPLPRTVLEQLPKLRLIVTTGMRNASIDLVAAREQGITVCGTPGSAAATIEIAWGLILSLTRNIPYEDRAIRQGAWQQTIGTGLAGTTLGLVGLGRLGKAMVPVARAFGMDVLAWSQNLTDEAAAEAGVTRVGRGDLFERSDIVSVHYVLSDRSRGLVGAPELAAMKSSAYLVNTSRGPIVDTSALIWALRNRRIAGAGLDVYDREPLPADHPLLELDNTVLTPHLGYVTTETYAKWYAAAADAIRAYVAGEPINVLEP